MPQSPARTPQKSWLKSRDFLNARGYPNEKFNQFPFSDATTDTPGERVNGVMFLIHWVNAGKTPALKSEVFSTRAITDAGALTPTFEKTAQTGEQTGTSLAPGMPFSSPGITIRQAEVESLRARQFRVFLYSRVDYEDTFIAGRGWHTEVCFEVKIDGQQTIQDAQGRTHTTDRFVFSPVGPQNTAS